MTRPTPPDTPPPKVQFDWQEWLPYIAEADLAEAEKQHMIETLWTIVLAFVDLGWDVSADPDGLDLAALLRTLETQSEAEKETL